MALTAKQKREARDQQMRDEGAAAAREGIKSTALNPDQSAAVEQLNQQQFKDPLAAKSSVAEPPKRSGRTVVVACKLGVASYQIQLGRMAEKFEQNLQGGRTIKENEWYGPIVILRGTAYPRGTPPEGFPPPPVIVGGAALNYGIDADWWDQWMQQHKNDPLVINKIIFAHESEDAVKGAAKEMSGFLSGLEPINPKKDARITKSTRSEVSDIAPDDTRLKARTPNAA